MNTVTSWMNNTGLLSGVRLVAYTHVSTQLPCRKELGVCAGATIGAQMQATTHIHQAPHLTTLGVLQEAFKSFILLTVDPTSDASKSKLQALLHELHRYGIYG
jgi:hypothetical protein